MANPKKIFLTGGGGFIGRNITEQIGVKYEILAPSRQELDLLDELAVQKFLSANPVDVVIHAANVGGTRRDAATPDTAKTNIKMFLNLARQLKPGQKMIFLGSGAEYDKRRDLKQVKEEDFGKSIPADEYGFAKYSCSRLIEKTDNIISLRCFGVYGKYEDYTQRFISNAILDVLAHRPINIGQNVWFDYLYVDDLVKIIDYFISHKGKYKFYNAASGQRVDLLTLAGTVEKISGSKQGIVVLRGGLNKEYTADNSRLMEEIPDFQFTSLEQGIGKLFQYYSAVK
jgi:GDP-L-fucose synthase